jgi:hypothetical protein
VFRCPPESWRCRSVLVSSADLVSRMRQGCIPLCHARRGRATANVCKPASNLAGERGRALSSVSFDSLKSRRGATYLELNRDRASRPGKMWEAVW